MQLYFPDGPVGVCVSDIDCVLVGGGVVVSASLLVGDGVGVMVGDAVEVIVAVRVRVGVSVAGA